MFASRCAACHGADGRGNGPASASLTPKPRNYTDVTWQKSVTDEQIKKTITLGGASVGKSPIMPASPDIEQNPQMLEGLVTIESQGWSVQLKRGDSVRFSAEAEHVYVTGARSARVLTLLAIADD